MNVSQVLNAAADKIERDGWCQGTFGRGSSGLPAPTCVLGAMCAVTSIACILDPVFYKAELALVRAIPGPAIDGLHPAPQWNDAPERTKEEVIAMLRAVAATERARESRLLPVVREQVPA